MARKFWVAKDSVWYEIYNEEPSYGEYIGKGWGENSAATLCPESFEEITGIKLKNGEFVQVELKEISDRYYYE